MLYKFVEILLSAVILAPVFGLLNMLRFHNRKRAALYFVFGVYLAAVYLFVGLPTVQYMRFELNLEWMPFVPMLADLKNTILNVALFVPLGVMLPLLWKQYHSGKAVFRFGLGMTAAIEVLQILTLRATDINDVIANSLGTLIGYWICKAVLRIVPAAAGLADREKDIPVVFAAVLLVMFFLQPYLAEAFYLLT